MLTSNVCGVTCSWVEHRKKLALNVGLFVQYAACLGGWNADRFLLRVFLVFKAHYQALRQPAGLGVSVAGHWAASNRLGGKVFRVFFSGRVLLGLVGLFVV